MTVKTQLNGAAGVYWLAGWLSARGFHVAVTYGNAPMVDLLVSTEDGAQAVSVQVKTSDDAQRWRGKGKERKLSHFEWELGQRLVREAPDDLTVALVDLRHWGRDESPANEEADRHPTVRFLEAREIKKRFQGASLSRWRLSLMDGEEAAAPGAGLPRLEARLKSDG